jgi:hypothetical protein
VGTSLVTVGYHSKTVENLIHMFTLCKSSLKYTKTNLLVVFINVMHANCSELIFCVSVKLCKFILCCIKQCMCKKPTFI